MNTLANIGAKVVEIKYIEEMTMDRRFFGVIKLGPDPTLELIPHEQVLEVRSSATSTFFPWRMVQMATIADTSMVEEEQHE